MNNIHTTGHPCIHTYPPNIEKESECQVFWNKAKNAVFSTVAEQFDFVRNAEIIEITEMLTKKKHTCYKDDSWINQGWCNLEQSSTRRILWGFCSSSCMYMNTTADIILKQSVSSIYCIQIELL